MTPDFAPSSSPHGKLSFDHDAPAVLQLDPWWWQPTRHDHPRLPERPPADAGRLLAKVCGALGLELSQKQPPP